MPGRDSGQVTLFDSVGFAIEDFSALRYIRNQVQRTAHHVELDMLADPDAPRALPPAWRRKGAKGLGTSFMYAMFQPGRSRAAHHPGHDRDHAG